MGAVKTALAFKALSADTTDLLGLDAVASTATLESFSFNISPTEADGAGLGQAYGFAQLCKIATSIDAKCKMVGTTARTTNLDISVFSIGGVDYLGTLKSGSVKVVNATADGSGVADKFTYPNAVGSTITMTGKLLVPTVIHALLTAAMSATITTRNVALVITIGGITVTAPMLLASVVHTATRGGLQELDITLSGRGTPTTPATPASIYVTAITGTAACTIWADTGAGQYGLTGARIPCIIEECSFDFADGAIVTNSWKFGLQGTVAYATT